ncbi:MAG: LPS assembly protein LptD [Candidatus Binatia bacterium]|nr:LPS assembly protein LptD [Candidatus Binatia bacterium]
MGHRQSLLLVCILWAMGAGAAYGQGPLGDSFGNRNTESEGITIDADSVSYNREKGKLEAKGDVVITNGETILVADQIEVDRSTSEATARGRVVLEDPGARIRAQRAVLSLQEETGVLDDVEIYLPMTRFQMRGAWMAKGFGQRYQIRDGELTTCQCESGAPDWSISSRQVDLTLEGWGEVHDGVFKIKDVPVFYIPYGLIPVREQRHSGFLFPRFGISNRRGFQYVQPFFWAIDKSQDLTLTFDLESSARIGLIGDYRYMLSPETAGRISLSYFNESLSGDRQSYIVDPETLADPTVPENRWSVIGQHRQPGPWESALYAKPFLVSDSLFLREMNTLTFLPARSLNLTTLRYTTSEVGALKFFDDGFLKAEAVWYQDLIQEQAKVPQALPRVSLLKTFNLLDGNLRLGLNTQGVYYYREEWASGGRIDIAPEATVPFNLGPYGFGSVKLTLRETAYFLTDNQIPDWPPVEGVRPTREVASFQNRETLQLQANFRSELARVFNVDRGDFLKLKHVIQPYGAYTYVPEVNQEDLPLWDSLDRINARNLVTYGIATKFLGKFRRGGRSTAGVPAGETEGNALVGEALYGPAAAPVVDGGQERTQVREIASAYIQQSFSVVDSLVPESDDLIDRFSGIDLGFQVSPVNWASVRSRAVVSVADRSLLFAEVGANLFDPRPRPVGDSALLPGLRPANSATLYYQFNSGGALENLNLAATYRLNDHIAASYLGRYDVIAGRFLENWLGLRLISPGDCWVVDLAVVDRVNPDEIDFRIQVSLVGLGSLGDSPFRSFTNSFPSVGGARPAAGALY